MSKSDERLVFIGPKGGLFVLGENQKPRYVSQLPPKVRQQLLDNGRLPVEYDTYSLKELSKGAIWNKALREVEVTLGTRIYPRLPAGQVGEPLRPTVVLESISITEKTPFKHNTTTETRVPMGKDLNTYNSVSTTSHLPAFKKATKLMGKDGLKDFGYKAFDEVLNFAFSTRREGRLSIAELGADFVAHFDAEKNGELLLSMLGSSVSALSASAGHTLQIGTSSYGLVANVLAKDYGKAADSGLSVALTGAALYFGVPVAVDSRLIAGEYKSGASYEQLRHGLKATSVIMIPANVSLFTQNVSTVGQLSAGLNGRPPSTTTTTYHMGGASVGFESSLEAGVGIGTFERTTRSEWTSKGNSGKVILNTTEVNENGTAFMYFRRASDRLAMSDVPITSNGDVTTTHTRTSADGSPMYHNTTATNLAPADIQQERKLLLAAVGIDATTITGFTSTSDGVVTSTTTSKSKTVDDPQTLHRQHEQGDYTKQTGTTATWKGGSAQFLRREAGKFSQTVTTTASKEGQSSVRTSAGTFTQAVNAQHVNKNGVTAAFTSTATGVTATATATAPTRATGSSQTIDAVTGVHERTTVTGSSAAPVDSYMYSNVQTSTGTSTTSRNTKSSSSRSEAGRVLSVDVDTVKTPMKHGGGYMRESTTVVKGNYKAIVDTTEATATQQSSEHRVIDGTFTGGVIEQQTTVHQASLTAPTLATGATAAKNAAQCVKDTYANKVAAWNAPPSQNDVSTKTHPVVTSRHGHNTASFEVRSETFTATATSSGTKANGMSFKREEQISGTTNLNYLNKQQVLMQEHQSFTAQETRKTGYETQQRSDANAHKAGFDAHGIPKRYHSNDVASKSGSGSRAAKSTNQDKSKGLFDGDYSYSDAYTENRQSTGTR